MLIPGLEGLVGLDSGKCGKCGTFETCRSPLLTLVKKNCRPRASIMFPVTGSDKTIHYLVRGDSVPL